MQEAKKLAEKRKEQIPAPQIYGTPTEKTKHPKAS